MPFPFVLILEGLRMSSVQDSAITDTVKWTRAAMIVARLALLVFLVWVLVSAKIPANNPVAEDSPTPAKNSRTVAEPRSAPAQQIG